MALLAFATVLMQQYDQQENVRLHIYQHSCCVCLVLQSPTSLDHVNLLRCA